MSELLENWVYEVWLQATKGVIHGSRIRGGWHSARLRWHRTAWEWKQIPKIWPKNLTLHTTMWDLPRPGFEPMSPALAGGFLTTGPPGKSLDPYIFKVPLLPSFNPLTGLVLHLTHHNWKCPQTLFCRWGWSRQHHPWFQTTAVDDMKTSASGRRGNCRREYYVGRVTCSVRGPKVSPALWHPL